jgi:hypothetical protein
MERTIQFFTDAAILAIFDPQRLAHWVDRDAGSWCGDFLQIEELRSGAIALVSLGGDGIYCVRLTDGDLNPDERDYADERVAGLGVEVVSSGLFIGPGECLPGGGSAFTHSDLERGVLCEMDNGVYAVDVYSIRWFDSPRWWTEDHTMPVDAPADFVITLRPRTGPIATIDAEPRLKGLSDAFLFDSSTRQIGPQRGMILTTTVRKAPNGLTLKSCGPCEFSATLTDYAQVAWKDTIRFRVLTVDHGAKVMTGEFVDIVRRSD